jgi:hypothetical protein
MKGEIMAALSNYDTDEDPEEFARRVCEWHAANNDSPLTHEEVMIVHLLMADPESRRRCKAKVQALTAPGGEFEHLRLEGKFAVNRKHLAERYGLPYRRVRRLPVVNRMKVVTKHRASLAARTHLPAAVKEPLSRLLDAFEQNTARYLSIGRSMEMMEGTREVSSACNGELRAAFQTISHLTTENEYLREALLASLGGQRFMPPAGEDGNTEG